VKDVIAWVEAVQVLDAKQGINGGRVLVLVEMLQTEALERRRNWVDVAVVMLGWG